MAVHPLSISSLRLVAGRWLRSGFPTSPREVGLRLLPSGPDRVRRSPPRGTLPSTLRAVASPEAPDLEGEFNPAEAGCGFRAPPAPHLARPFECNFPSSCCQNRPDDLAVQTLLTEHTSGHDSGCGPASRHVRIFGRGGAGSHAQVIAAANLAGQPHVLRDLIECGELVALGIGHRTRIAIQNLHSARRAARVAAATMQDIDPGVHDGQHQSLAVLCAGLPIPSISTVATNRSPPPRSQITRPDPTSGMIASGCTTPLSHAGNVQSGVVSRTANQPLPKALGKLRGMRPGQHHRSAMAVP